MAKKKRRFISKRFSQSQFERKNRFLIILIIILAVIALLIAAIFIIQKIPIKPTPPGGLGECNFFNCGGDGSEASPFLISDCTQLQNIRENLDSSYVITNDIDCSSISFESIGKTTAFSGSLDGNNHVITGLFGEGLFKRLSGVVKNVELKNVNVICGSFAYENLGLILNSSADGTVINGDCSSSLGSAIEYPCLSFDFSAPSIEIGPATGGLVAINFGNIESSSYSGFVNGENQVGGLVGFNNKNIINSYSNAYVNGNVNVGGITGVQVGNKIENSYFNGTVNGVAGVGGLIGHNFLSLVKNAFTIGDIYASSHMGGIIGYHSCGEQQMVNSFFNNNLDECYSGSGNISGCTKNYDSSYFYSNNLGWDENIWKFTGIKLPVFNKFMKVICSDSDLGLKYFVKGMVIGNIGSGMGYEDYCLDDSVLIERYCSNDPDVFSKQVTCSNGCVDGACIFIPKYNIETCEDLQYIDGDLSGNYYLANDIDCSATNPNNINNAGSIWDNNGAGFEPIGYFGYFTGTFDGRGYFINNLYINQNIRNEINANVGLFGYSRGLIKNVYLNANIFGYSHVGGLVGMNERGEILNSYTTGNIAGNDNLGGLVGWSQGGNISNCYSNANVNGTGEGGGYFGGLVGMNSGANILNSYSTGNVTHSLNGIYMGGLVGQDQGGGTISNSYSTGKIKTTGGGIGGLVGNDVAGGLIINSFFTDENYDNGFGILETGGESAFFNSGHEVYTYPGSSWDKNIWYFSETKYPVFRLTGKVNYIDSCRVIDSPGIYVMNKSIGANVYCINISASDVTFNCNGHYIFRASLSAPGIYSRNTNNILIKNCNSTMSSLSGSGISLVGVSNSIIDNFTTSGNGYAIKLENINNIIIRNSRIAGSGKFGVLINNSLNLLLDSNNISSNGSGVFAFSSSSINLTNNKISSGSSYYDLISNNSANINLLNQEVTKYSVSSSSINFANSHGKIIFSNLNLGGANLFGYSGSDILIENNHTYINPSLVINPVTVKFYNLPNGTATIIRDGVPCSTQCSNLGWNNGYEFSINSGGDYSIRFLCISNWNCSAWSACSGSIQTRKCTDLNLCGTDIGKPSETQSCSDGGGGSSGGGSSGGGSSGGGGSNLVKKNSSISLKNNTSIPIDPKTIDSNTYNTETPAITAEPTKNFNWIYYVLIMVLIAVIFAVVFLLFKNYNLLFGNKQMHKDSKNNNALEELRKRSLKLG